MFPAFRAYKVFTCEATQNAILSYNSVCLSVILRHCVETAVHIVEITSPPFSQLNVVTKF